MTEKKPEEKKIIEKRVVKKSVADSTYKPPTMKSLLKQIQALEKALELKKEIAEIEPVKELQTLPSEDLQDKMERLRLHDRELQLGTFRFHDVKGGHIKFTFQKWGKDPIETFLLVDGVRYALPRGVAKHLRDSGKFKSYPGSSAIGETVKREAVISNRYSFERDDFGENEDISKIPKGYAPLNPD